MTFALLPTTAAQAAPAPDAKADQSTSSSADRGHDLSEYVPEGKLEMTAQQRDRLDAQVERTLQNSRPGGKRVAPDTIVWEDQGAILNFPVNGKVRDYGSQGLDGRVRLWQDAGYSGRRLTFVKCKFQKLRWYNFTNKTSSWRNTQTGGAESRLYYWNGSKVKFMDSLAPGEQHSWTWSNHPLNDKADFLRVCK